MLDATIALCVPHTPWRPERVESLQRLRDALGSRPKHYLEYTEREPNRVWALAVWRWLRDTRADFCLVLQDDVMVPDFFWPVLRAQMANLPRRGVLGLTAVHPIGREIERRGHRWFRTSSWNVGWAYGLWRDDFDEFVTFAEKNQNTPHHEDDFLNVWVSGSGRATWHPVPTIVDHDTSLLSNGSGDTHSCRRPAVTWRGYKKEELADPSFWRVSGAMPEMFPCAPQRGCLLCGKHSEAWRGPNGGGVCVHCLAAGSSHVLKQVHIP